MKPVAATGGSTWWARALVWSPWVLGALGLWTILILSPSFLYDGSRYFTLLDDAMISLTYARTFAQGNGLVWFPGAPPVEGYTNLFWTLLMSLVEALGLHEARVPLVINLVGVAVVVSTGAVARAIARELGAQAGSTAVFGLVCLSLPLSYWSVRGMEVGLISLGLCAAVLLALTAERTSHRVFTAAGLCLISGAMVLTRLDAGLLLGGVIVWLWWHPGFGRRLGLLCAAAIVAAVAAHTALRWQLYGEWLPNTYYLKLGGVPLTFRLARGALALIQSATFSGLVLLFAAGVAAAGARPESVRQRRLLFGVLACSVAYSVYVGGDAWEFLGILNRYLAPALPLAIILLVERGQAALGSQPSSPRPLTILAATAALLLVLSELSNALLSPERWGLRHGAYSPAVGWSALTAGLIALLITLHLNDSDVLRRQGRWLFLSAVVVLNGPGLGHLLTHGVPYAQESQRMARYGLVLRHALAGEQSIGVVWAGAIAYYAQRPMVDLLGKSDPAVARLSPRVESGRPGHTKWDYALSLRNHAPSVVAQLYRPTAVDERTLHTSGYRPLPLRTPMPSGLFGDAQVPWVRFGAEEAARLAAALEDEFLPPLEATAK